MAGEKRASRAAVVAKLEEVAPKFGLKVTNDFSQQDGKALIVSNSPGAQLSINRIGAGGAQTPLFASVPSASASDWLMLLTFLPDAQTLTPVEAS